jgi:hypothetical protein
MSFELTPHQQIFLNLYSSFYEQVTQQHSSLLEQSNRLIPIMNELRHNIQAIYTDARAESTRRQQSTTPSSAVVFSSSATYSNVLSTSAIFGRERPPSRERPPTGTTNRIFSDIHYPLNTECPISLVPFEPNSEVSQINVCGHIFVRSELAQWFQENTNCPTCRANAHHRIVVDFSNNIVT